MKIILILIMFTTLVLLSNPFGTDTVRAQVGTLEYYGYYGAPWPSAAEQADDDTTSFTNVAFVGYSPTYSQATLQNYINHRKNQGHKIILSLSGYLYRYLYENKTIPDNVWREFLNGLKTKLGADKNKIYAFYLADEPNDHKDKDGDFMFRHNPERLEKIINITKEIFPDINTFIVFYTSWIRGSYIVNNENFDLIGVDPYFLSKGYAESVTYPYICNTQNRDKFESEVRNRIYWIKSGGGQIRYACANYYPDCTPAELEAIENLLASDTDKRIVMVGQGFMCNEYVGTWNISQIPGICQQQWYYDWSKADPDIEVFLWYKYSSAYYLTNTYIPYTNQGKGACLGVGSHVPDMLDDHVTWGLEVLCGNQDYEPFCTSEGVSYTNPSQAKCDGKSVTQPGGSGNNLCDTACGADQNCHGIAPGTGGCDDSCQISCYDNYFKVYPSNSGEQYGKYGGDDPSDSACCDNDEDCVYQGQCYSDGWYDLDGDGRTDMLCYWAGTSNYDWWINVDYYTSYCTGRGYHWNVGGGDARAEDAYYTTTGSRPNYCTIGTSGYPSVECCCGDDLGEEHAYRAAYKNTNQYHIAWNDVTSDDACCSTNEKCVFQGTCYDIGAQTSGFNPGEDDNYARCRSGGIHWLDIDYGASGCTASGLNFVTAGESGVGEYGSLTDGGDGTTECCGDDVNEVYEFCAIGFNISWSSDCTSSDDACCDSTSCVDPYQTTCYDFNNYHNVLGVSSGNDQYARCAGGGGWRDCDEGSTYCGGCAGISGFPCTAGGTNCWVYGGESSEFGEYTTGGEQECCGDDSGENYVQKQRYTTEYSGAYYVNWDTPTPDTNDDACCDVQFDCVEGGTCTSQGQLKSWPSWNHSDKLVVCDPANTNKWYDVDGGQTHCENRAGLDWVIAGESGVGEYGSLTDGGNGVTECCGDDSDEFYNYFNLHWAERGNKYGPDNTSDDVCCNNDEDCVYQGQCYDEGWHDLDNDSRTDMYCYALAGDFWLNVDYHRSYCTGRGYHWNVGGGDARAEDAYYTTTGSRPNYCTIGTSGHPSVDCCCGDDLGEYHVTTGVGPAGCCDNADDCVDGDGVCRIGTEGEFINKQGNLSNNCDDGIDNDCDGSVDGNDTGCLNPDLDNDGDVDIQDLIIVTSHLGLNDSDPGWNTTAEIVPDGVIDIYDLVFIASRFT